MMLTIDQIKQARTPQEALLVLATAIDHLHARIDELQAQPEPADLWSQPLEWAAPTEPLVDDLPSSDRAQQIAAVKEQIASTADPEDRRALEARLRLLQDEGGVIESPVAEGQRVKDDQPTVAGSPTQAISVGGGTVELPVVSPARQQFRREWALNRMLHEFIPLSEDEACDAYAKGGPMWLYLGNRPAVMAMPFAWRQELVEEIAKDSPAEAQEVGRDILKSVESADRQITEIAVNGV